jgi:nucleoside-diphosphate-sugar epimerase
MIKPARIVLISTTGVYGDVAGEWVDETATTNPKTERGQRRLDMEQQWSEWVASQSDIDLRIFRVPGIYARSRIPLARLKKATPVVRAPECGCSNRVHADDLARACIAALSYSGEHKVFNITDGNPGTITQYLQAAAEVAGLPPLPEISMAEAQQQLSAGMLSYLSESRKISNKKMREELKVAPLYPDFRIGLRH